jgi:hypothetical protein
MFYVVLLGYCNSKQQQCEIQQQQQEREVPKTKACDIGADQKLSLDKPVT